MTRYEKILTAVYALTYAFALAVVVKTMLEY
jgi:hypothetical protein